MQLLVLWSSLDTEKRALAKISLKKNCKLLNVVRLKLLYYYTDVLLE